MISYELRNTLLQFVNSELDVEQLENWLVPRLPILLASPVSSDADVIAAVELGLAEINDGIRTLDEFRSGLSEVLSGFSSVLVTNMNDVAISYMYTTGSSSVTLLPPVRITSNNFILTPS